MANRSAFFLAKAVQAEGLQEDNKRLCRYIQGAQSDIAIALEMLRNNDIEGAKDLLIDIYNELDRAVM